MGGRVDVCEQQAGGLMLMQTYRQYRNMFSSMRLFWDLAGCGWEPEVLQNPQLSISGGLG